MCSQEHLNLHRRTWARQIPDCRLGKCRAEVHCLVTGATIQNRQNRHVFPAGGVGDGTETVQPSSEWEARNETAACAFVRLEKDRVLRRSRRMVLFAPPSEPKREWFVLVRVGPQSQRVPPSCTARCVSPATMSPYSATRSAYSLPSVDGTLNSEESAKVQTIPLERSISTVIGFTKDTSENRC